MTRPTVHAFTDDVYAQLPVAYRDSDEKLDWPLLRYLSLLCDQLGEIVDVLNSIDVNEDDPTDTSALTDPETADVTWLRWLSQFVGIPYPPTPGPDLRGFGNGLFGSGYFGGVGNPSGVTDIRTAIRQRSFARGTKQSIINIAKRYLVDGAQVTVTERVGDRWHYSVHVYDADVLDQAALEFALNRENPAGMVLTLQVTAGTFDDLTASAATFDDLTAEFATFADMADYKP